MKIIVSLSDIEILKSKLAKLIPDVQSSHRTEALARGLGWQTNAALRAALKDHKLERAVGEHAFAGYLVSRWMKAPPGVLTQAIVECGFSERDMRSGPAQNRTQSTEVG